MTTEQALLVLLACIVLGVLTLAAVTAQRLTGAVRLRLELGARETVTSQVTQPLHTPVTLEVPATVENHPEASVKAVVYPTATEDRPPRVEP